MPALLTRSSPSSWQTWTPAQKARHLPELRRRAAVKHYPDPLELAKLLDPRTVRTPALDRIATELVEVSEGRNDRLIISIPPQEGKSSTATRAAPLWQLIRNPNTRVVVVSYEHGIARRWGRTIRNDIAQNPQLGLTVRTDTSAAHEWQLSGHVGGIVTTGIGGALTGRPCDLMIIDDPVKGIREGDSQTYRDIAWEWWESVGSTRLAPGAPVILILTRWNEDDLAGRLMAHEPGRWRYVNIPAQADHHPERGETDILGRQPGEYLLSARGRTVAQWEQIKRQVGTRVWTSLYQGRPSPDSGNVWQRPWWRRYSVPLWSQHPDRHEAFVVPEADELVMSWDMAFKDTKASDYVVGQVWARRGANVYLLDQIHKRLTFTETVAAFVRFVARWPQATAKLVEDKANGTAIIDTLRSKIPGIVAVTPTESKYARANAVAPIVEAGNVHLPDPRIALFDPEGLIDEAAAFPNGAHDDQVDATSQALAAMMLDGTGAQAWIDHLKRKTQQPVDEPPPAVAAAPPEPTDPLRAARNAAFRQQQGGQRG